MPEPMINLPQWSRKALAAPALQSRRPCGDTQDRAGLQGRAGSHGRSRGHFFECMVHRAGKPRWCRIPVLRDVLVTIGMLAVVVWLGWSLGAQP